MFAGNKRCPPQGDCKASMIAFGAGVEYHIVDGASIDPWVRMGLGYRIMRYDFRWDGTDTQRSYSGLDWLHLAIGGDWYPTTVIGFGPYIALDVGTYGKRPGSAPPQTSGERGSATHTVFSLGLRIAFDPMR